MVRNSSSLSFPAWSCSVVTRQKNTFVNSNPFHLFSFKYFIVVYRYGLSHFPLKWILTKPLRCICKFHYSSVSSYMVLKSDVKKKLQDMWNGGNQQEHLYQMLELDSFKIQRHWALCSDVQSPFSQISNLV